MLARPYATAVAVLFARSASTTGAVGYCAHRSLLSPPPPPPPPPTVRTGVAVALAVAAASVSVVVVVVVVVVFVGRRLLAIADVEVLRRRADEAEVGSAAVVAGGARWTGLLARRPSVLDRRRWRWLGGPRPPEALLLLLLLLLLCACR